MPNLFNFVINMLNQIYNDYKKKGEIDRAYTRTIEIERLERRKKRE
jgi:hypothetical protein